MTTLPRPIVVGKTIIVSSGCYGRYLGVLDFVHKPLEGTKLVSYRLPKITQSIPEDEKLAQNIAGYKSIVEKNYLRAYGVTFDQNLAEMAFDMESLTDAYEHPGEMPLGNLITDAYRYAIEKAEGPRYDYVHAVIEPLGPYPLFPSCGKDHVGRSLPRAVFGAGNRWNARLSAPDRLSHRPGSAAAHGS